VGTTANGEIVHIGMDVMLTKILDNSPPRYILDIIREKTAAKSQKFSERELRILRFVCRVALGIEDV